MLSTAGRSVRRSPLLGAPRASSASRYPPPSTCPWRPSLAAGQTHDRSVSGNTRRRAREGDGRAAELYEAAAQERRGEAARRAGGRAPSCPTRGIRSTSSPFSKRTIDGSCCQEAARARAGGARLREEVLRSQESRAKRGEIEAGKREQAPRTCDVHFQVLHRPPRPAGGWTDEAAPRSAALHAGCLSPQERGGRGDASPGLREVRLRRLTTGPAAEPQSGSSPRNTSERAPAARGKGGERSRCAARLQNRMGWGGSCLAHRKRARPLVARPVPRGARVHEPRLLRLAALLPAGRAGRRRGRVRGSGLSGRSCALVRSSGRATGPAAAGQRGRA